LRWPALFAWSAAFAVAHTQAPLYFSNQNQYLLHGAAAGGHAALAGDWLANTADPTPLFSAVVALLYRFLDPALLHPLYVLVLMGYFAAAVRLAEAAPGYPAAGPGRFVAPALLVAAHAGFFRWLSVRWAGYDYPWLLQCGLAGQYVLGPSVQPSAFGPLLLGGVAAAARRRPYLAAVLFAAAGVVHTTYLHSGAVLTAGLMLGTLRERGARPALAAGLLALVIVLPVVAYTAVVFGPTDADTYARAQELIAVRRIPHHVLIPRWFDHTAWFTCGWMLAGLAAARRTAAYPVLAVAAGLAVAGTLLVWATDSRTLALLFPWRVSAVLVPAATALLAGRLAAVAGRAVAALSLLLAAVAVAGGVAVLALGLGYHHNPNEDALLAFVRRMARPGDVYLIPARYPDLLAAPKGNPSASFVTPTPSRDVIPVDLQRFRLVGGAAIYVDFKSIPYRDADLVEWDRRLRNVQRWYANRTWTADVIGEMKAEGITHVVAAADRDVTSPALEPVYADEAYRVYRIKP
jgi:hypothetical protein